MERGRHRVLLAACMVVSLVLISVSATHAQGTHSGQNSACIFDHMTLRSPTTICRPRAKAYPPTVTGRVQRSIYDSSLIFGIPYSVLLNIAKCESSLNPRASNGTHFGLFQFAPATFRRAAVQLKATTGLTARSYWNPLDSSYVAGFMFATGDAM